MIKKLIFIFTAWDVFLIHAINFFNPMEEFDKNSTLNIILKT